MLCYSRLYTTEGHSRNGLVPLDRILKWKNVQVEGTM